MPVAYDSVTPDTESAAGTTTLTSGAWTIAGADRLLIGVIGTGDLTGSNPTGMDHPAAGGALTQIGATLSIGTHAKLSTWRLIAPAAASNTTKGTWAASQGEACIGGVSYTGVDQTTPAGTSVTATGAVTTATFTATAPALTTVVGNLCFAVAFFHETGSPGATGATPGGGATGRYDIEAAQIGGWGALQCAEFVATGTSTVMSVDFSDAVARNGSWGIIAFVVNAAAGGGGAASSHTDTGQTRNRPGRGPHSLGKFFRPRIDAYTQTVASHATSGELVAGAATVAGTAAHQHVATGALLAQAAVLAGTAAHLTLHATTGALVSDAATVAGTAVHLTLHTATGALVAQAATVAGTATHLTLHTSSGALVAGDAQISGDAVGSGGVTTQRDAGAGKSRRPRQKTKHERYLVRYKGHDYEFGTLHGLEQFVADTRNAEKAKPKANRAPVRITLTPEFADEIAPTIQAPQRLWSMPPSAALAQVRKIEHDWLQRQRNIEDDDEEVLLWLMVTRQI